MRPKTTTALALTGTLLAAPAALAAEADDPPSPLRAALRAPVGGHLTVQAQMRAEARDIRQAALERRTVRLARKVAKARDARFDAAAERARVRDQAPARLRERMDDLRDDLARIREENSFTASPTMQAIAECESGGDPTTNTGNGFYGKYQFDLQTWAAVGGSGVPSEASEAEQDRRATMLYEQAGASPWPVCGR